MAERIPIKAIREPMAFVSPSRKSSGSGYTRVVVFSELQGGGANSLYHAFQVSPGICSYTRARFQNVFYCFFFSHAVPGK